MLAQNEAGQQTLIDASLSPQPQGLSPMQLVLAALGACSSIDLKMILDKQKQGLEAWEVQIQGQRRSSSPQVFENINLHFDLYGSIETEKAQKALALSFEKYCSVAKMLETSVELSYTFALHPSKS